jgi:putative methyltransferase (TIGR04325 family)
MRTEDLLPPVLFRFGRKLRRLQKRGRETYDSYASALAKCRGYQDRAIIQTVVAKTRRLRESLADRAMIDLDVATNRLLAALAMSVRDDHLNVIDFGGACGTHFLYARALFPPSINITWHVVETPAMVDGARQFENESLRFFSRLEDARAALPHVDLAFSSSTTQCTPDPLKTTQDLVNLEAANLCITRTGMSHEPRVLRTVQHSFLRYNGPGPMPRTMVDGPTSFPLTIVPLAQMMQIIQQAYDVVYQACEQKRVYVFDQYEIDLWGIFGRRRAAAAPTLFDGIEAHDAPPRRAA